MPSFATKKCLSSPEGFTIIKTSSLFPLYKLLKLIPSPSVIASFIPSHGGRTSSGYVDVFAECVVNGKRLRNVIARHKGTPLIINNISFWCLYKGIKEVYHDLKILSKTQAIIGFILSDTLDQLTEDSIVSLSQNIIQVDGDVYGGSIKGRARLSTGKMEYFTEGFSMSQGQLTFSKVEVTRTSHQAENETSNIGVTFEMGLSAREKEARAATVLPHNENRGAIHYIPDEVDDWDDEDPDDDLDI